MKDGAIRLHPVVVWNIPDADTLRKSSMSDTLIKVGESLQWPWRRRLRQTLDLRNYVGRLERNDVNEWRIFQGSDL